LKKPEKGVRLTIKKVGIKPVEIMMPIANCRTYLANATISISREGWQCEIEILQRM